MSEEFRKNGSQGRQPSLWQGSMLRKGEAGPVYPVAENDMPKEAPQQAKRPGSQKKYLGLSVVLICVIVVAVCLLFVDFGPPEQKEWSSWSDELPEYATDDFYQIEEKTLYRSRTLETTSSTTQSQMTGWEMYEMVEGNGDFGPWSNWAAGGVTASDTREVETQTQYRYRDKETTTADQSTLSGWNSGETTYEWGEYGQWSDWSESVAVASDSRRIEKKTQYSSRQLTYKETDTPTLDGWTLDNTLIMYGPWSEWSTTPITASDSLEVETYQEYRYTRYFLAHYCTGNVSGAQWQSHYSNHSASETFNANCVYHALGWFDSLDSFTERPLGSHTGYIGDTCSNSCWTWYIMDEQDVYTTYYRSRPVHYKYVFCQHTPWSDWTDTVLTATEFGMEVKTRDLYRYSDREQIPTYHFWRWEQWSSWSANAVSESQDRQVQTMLYYRFRDRQTEITYYFRRWGAWSEYSDTPLSADEVTQVETVKRYRFKSKDSQ